MTITHDEIRKRAREIWERQGCPEGKDMEHWLQAEAELREESEKRDSGNLSAVLQTEDSMLKVPADSNNLEANRKRSVRRAK